MKNQVANSNLHFLDGLRGLAALYVVVGHARWLLWEGFSGYQQHPQTYSLMQRVFVYFFSLFRYGHEAVLFFFVLSGFVIHLRYAHQLEQQGLSARFDWANFVWRRARRLYPPVLAALALTWILYLIGNSAGYPIYHSATMYPAINQNVVCSVDGWTLLGNLAFLMETYVPVFGGNGPLWSLKFEWWFYMIYPGFWWLSKRTLSGATALMAGLFVAALAVEWPVLLLQDVFSAMLTWWLGVLLADVYSGRLKIPWNGVVAVCMAGLLGTGCFKQTHDLSMAFLFAALLALGFLAQSKNIRLSYLGMLKPLGDMSYTLYVIHFPILILLSGWLMSRSPQGVLPSHLGWVMAGVPVTLLLAYGLHRVAERPFLNRRVGS